MTSSLNEIKKIDTSESIRLNIGGKYFTTSIQTLRREKTSLLATLFSGRVRLQTDLNGNYFIDRDGILFSHILDYLRTGKLLLREGFNEFNRLKQEAEYYKLGRLLIEIEKYEKKLEQLEVDGLRKSKKTAGHFITVSTRATFAFGAKEQADVAFPKTPRIAVAGHAGLCRDIFQDTLNDGRDPNHGPDRYTNRFFLNHSSLHKAFEHLQDKGFALVSSCAGKAGYEGRPTIGRQSIGDKMNEEGKWNHLLLFVFFRSY